MLLLFINGLRSLNKKLVQFIGLISLIFLSVTIFSGITQSNRELKRAFNTLISKGNSQHFVYYPVNKLAIKSSYPIAQQFFEENSAIISNFKDEEEVIDWIITKHLAEKFAYRFDKRRLYEKKTNFNNKNFLYNLVAADYYQYYDEVNSNNEPMNKVIITKGRKPIIDNEVIIFEQFADANGLKIYDDSDKNNPKFYLPGIGDLNNLENTGLRIVGFGMTPDYIIPKSLQSGIGNPIPDFSNETFIYLNSWKFDRLAVNSSVIQEQYFGQFNSSYEWNASVEKEYNNLEKYFNNLVLSKTDGNAIYSLYSNWTVNPIFIQMQSNTIIAITFLSLIIVIVLVIIVFLIKRDINSEKLKIGLLKAIGYSDVAISFSFLGVIIISSFVGSLLGYASGLLVEFALSKLSSNHIQLPISFISFDWQIFLISFMVPLIFLTILSFIFTNIFLKKSAIKLLSPGSLLKIGVVKLFLLKLTAIFSFKIKTSFSLVIKSFSRVLIVVISMIATTILLIFVFLTSTVVSDSIDKSFSAMKYNFNYAYDNDFLLKNTINDIKFLNTAKINETKKRLNIFELVTLLSEQRLDEIFTKYYIPAELLDLVYFQLDDFISNIANKPLQEQNKAYENITNTLNKMLAFKYKVTSEQVKWFIENWYFLQELADISTKTITNEFGKTRKMITTNIGFNFIPYQEDDLPYLLFQGTASDLNDNFLGNWKIHSVNNKSKDFLLLQDTTSQDLYNILQKELIRSQIENEDWTPILVNYVDATSNNIKIDDIYQVDFSNNYNGASKSVKFKVVGIIDFYQMHYMYAPDVALRKIFTLDADIYNAKFSKDKYLEVEKWLTFKSGNSTTNLTELKPLLSSLWDTNIARKMATKYNTMISIIISILIIFSTIIAGIILLMITNIVINENKQIILMFQIMGYKIYEITNIIMGLYIPTIIISFLIGIPISLFILNNLFIFIAKATNFAFPVILSWWQLLIILTIELVVYCIAYFAGVFKLHREGLSHKIKEVYE